MRTLESLNLIVPKLGIDSTKRITGGRDWNGYLQPSICYGDNNNNSGPSWDSWYNDYLYDHADPDYGANSGVGGAPDYNGSGSSDSDYDYDDDLSNITFGDNIDDSVKEQIQKFIQSLPEELQNQEIKIVIDPDLLKECSGSDDKDFSGVDDALFLYKSHALNPYDTDVIILRDQNQIPDLFEELLHVWQYNNCMGDESKMSKADRSAMEFQAAIVEYINLLRDNPDYAGSNGFDLGDITTLIWNSYSTDNSNFDINHFLELVEESGGWQQYYDYWSDNNLLGDVSNDYNWMWESILNIIAPTSDTGGSCHIIY